jgi:hypothetical protein
MKNFTTGIIFIVAAIMVYAERNNDWKEKRKKEVNKKEDRRKEQRNERIKWKPFPLLSCMCAVNVSEYCVLWCKTSHVWCFNNLMFS